VKKAPAPSKAATKTKAPPAKPAKAPAAAKPAGGRTEAPRAEAATKAAPAPSKAPAAVKAAPAAKPTKGPSPAAAKPGKAPAPAADRKGAQPAVAAEAARPERAAAPPEGPAKAAPAAKPAEAPRAQPAEEAAKAGGAAPAAPEEAPPPRRYPPPKARPPIVLVWSKPVAEPPEKGDLPFPVLRRDKVREVYQISRSELLIVTSDRVSAFDVVMKEPIPRKGEVLTMLTAWWLARLETKGVEHHLISVHPDQIAERHPELAKTRKQWERRAMLVRKTDPIPVESVVRGYLAGSAWKEYVETHYLAGERLPDEMLEGQRLPRPMFAPATKAQEGHDENITPAEVRQALGEQLATRIERLALRIYDHGRRAAESSGIILADTKYEFGLDLEGRLLLIDEVMTPDSSRYWPKQSYAPGKTQPSLDKQPIRDWLETQPEPWDKKPPPPKLPPQVVSQTTDRYLEIFRRLTGTTLDEFQPPLMRSPVS
jgi:phosphoribosylaminoimidazole-succinocarboxamide synthase